MGVAATKEAFCLRDDLALQGNKNCTMVDDTLVRRGFPDPHTKD